MKTIRTYVSAFLVASCMLVALPNQAMNSGVQSGNSKLFALPSLQTISDLTVKIKNTVLENRHVSATILAGVLTGSYLCYKYFFKKNATPVVKQNTAPIINEEVKPVITQATKPIVKQEVVAQEKPNSSPEVTQSEQISPVAHVVDKKKTTQFIEVMNDHDQSLTISFSSDNADCAQQFSIPGYSYSKININ